MSPTLQITALIATTMGLWVSLLRAPHWFCRSLHRHRLWRERDAVADDIIAGRLPREHQAVRELLEVADWSARRGNKHTIIEIFVWRAATRKCDESTVKALAVPLEGLEEEQLALLKHHRERITFLTTSSMLLGSWLGLLTILRYVAPARRVVRNLPEGREHGSVQVRATLLEATSEASRQTQLGRVAQEFIKLQEREVPHHVAV